jgi:phosphatidylserine/phosphatidylglycerophosphate/cardiolipin synthase-like enzyme
LKLLLQPGDGITPIVKAIAGAKRTIDVMIFRFNRKEIQTALVKAAGRGVAVRALIASTNRGGESKLRELETTLLAAGVTVARTADDLVRYHGKYMIVDRRTLFVMAFNLTFADIERSRSFAVITTNIKLVQEAAKLFEADIRRQPYEPSNPALLVSPLNARKELAKFIAGARKELLIYDPEVSDPAIVRTLAARAKAGVAIRIIGKLKNPIPGVQVKRLSGLRLHTRAIAKWASFSAICGPARQLVRSSTRIGTQSAHKARLTPMHRPIEWPRKWPRQWRRRCRQSGLWSRKRLEPWWQMERTSRWMPETSSKR